MNELYAICQTGEIEDGDATGFVLMRIEETGEPKPWPILITRKGNNFYGFENACPHKGERLDSEAGNFLDEEGISDLRPSGLFDLDTGHCFIGRQAKVEID
jgi:nitrite reductase/ring-hydroxylating ferredoxin subunit